MWEQFARYFEIAVYVLEGTCIPPAKVEEKLKFAKEILEGQAPVPIVDASVRSQEMSVRGTLGGQASAKSRRGLYSRAKKSRPPSSGIPTM